MATDRGIATELRFAHIDPAWFAGCDRLHLSGYSLMRSPIDTAAFRAARPGALDLPYGPGDRAMWDLYPATNPEAPCLVFIHGGYWQRGSKEATVRLENSGEDDSHAVERNLGREDHEH